MPLDKYRQKRKAGATPEPFGGHAPPTGNEGARVFCVQKHAATRLHYDFRLEHNGVLLSWAVPKGPSYDPKEKRYAVHVEDHPLEYAGFEGIIPEDNYGAGEVILWDKGTFVPLEDFDDGMKKGKLLFELSGFKLRGIWTLVRTKKSQKDWLLIKHKDAHAGRAEPPDQSVLSGLTLDEVRDRSARLSTVRAQLKELEAPKRALGPEALEPMLAELAPAPFSRAGWLFEIKFDGFRLLAERKEGRATLYYRRGMDATALYPDLERALAALPVEDCVLDGEVAVHDGEGRPSFQRLQKRAQLSRPADIARAVIELPAVYHVFDLLALDGHDLRGLPLTERKRLLSVLVPRVGTIVYADHLEERGADMFAAAKELGLEGVVAKRSDSTYRSGRSSDWLKLRVEKSGDFVIVGYTVPRRGRVGVGALHLAVWDPDDARLRYAGRVGTGLSDKQLDEIRRALDETRLNKPPCAGAPTGSGHVWARGERVCEVRYREWTEEGYLRQPVFLRFRSDKKPEECAPPLAVSAERAPPEPVTVEAPVDKSFTESNRDKIFWPDEKYTKGDLLDYYRAVSPWLLHYLRDRPVVLTRYPDGIAGKSFFQKDAPVFCPPWLRTERMWSEQAEREIDHFVCDDVESLLYLVNLGTIPLHVWGSRVKTLERPDWCILDLDPKGAPFSHVIEVALCVRELCEEIALPAYPKTSGSTGLHVLVPLGRALTFDQCKTLGELLARVVVDRLPERATVERVIGKRGGRVYVDFLQNGHGKLLAAPLGVRPLPGAPVSAPLEWREVKDGLTPGAFTIKNVPARLQRMKVDPLAPVVDETPDLEAILARLAGRVR